MHSVEKSLIYAQLSTLAWAACDASGFRHRAEDFSNFHLQGCFLANHSFFYIRIDLFDYSSVKRS